MKRPVPIAMLALVLISCAFVTVPVFSHQSDSGCTPKNHPTPVPPNATTIEQTGTQVREMDDGTTYVHGSTGWVGVNAGTGKVQANPSGERFSGTPLDDSPAEEAVDNSSLRVDQNGAKKICVEVAGEKVEP